MFIMKNVLICQYLLEKKVEENEYHFLSNSKNDLGLKLGNKVNVLYELNRENTRDYYVEYNGKKEIISEKN